MERGVATRGAMMIVTVTNLRASLGSNSKMLKRHAMTAQSANFN